MTLLTDAEQRKLNEEMFDGPTTQKINKRLKGYHEMRLKEEAEARKREQAAQEERILKQFAPVVEKQNEFEDIMSEFQNAVNFLRRKLGVKRRA